MSGVLRLVVVVLLINGFFTYIGLFLLPQAESHPPKEIKIEEGISVEELVDIGKEIVFGKGQCMVCHPVKAETGMRAPAISTIGALMEKEAKERGVSVEFHVFEALVAPGRYVSKGFENMMPPVHKPPIGLTKEELIAVGAYLQSQGSRVTISFPDSLKTLEEVLKKTGG